jgi:triosephosphate isomerase
MGAERYVLANFKMNKNLFEVKKWADEFLSLLYKGKKLSLKVGCAPTFIYIKALKEIVIGTGFLVGAQNMHFEEKGAFTGEVSPTQLKDIGVDFVIIGHSERRNIFGESDELISKKLVSALKHNILPVLCVGETKEEREKGETEKVLIKQISILSKIPDELKNQKIVIAYEPVWAIGTGIPATKDKIEKAVELIRKEASKFIKDFSVLYGGSIDEKVAEEIKDICDGGLVGTASLDPQKFYKISQNFDV